MFAIVTLGSKQYKVSPKEKIVVDLLQSLPGATVVLDEVLFVMKGKKVEVGTPQVKGARVRARVLRHIKGEKHIIFKYKPKKRYRKKKGARAALTELEILDISLGETTSKKSAKVGGDT